MPAMKLTVLGCSGSVPGPDSPASGYLLTAPGAPPLVLDLGGGSFGALQAHVDPAAPTVLLSHLHADHCLDVTGLVVWRRHHPSPPAGRSTVYAPAGAAHRLGAAGAEQGGEVDDVCDVLDVREWDTGHQLRIGSWRVRVARVEHPCEAYGMRITDQAGATLVYTGDTGACDAVLELARDADVLLAEASWTHAPGRPVGVHLSGTQAGALARDAGVGRLLLTHIPPWTSVKAVAAEAAAEFDGPVHAVRAREVHDLSPVDTPERADGPAAAPRGST
jgi:ribonuclease BN (tRNA processing enzyme)